MHASDSSYLLYKKYFTLGNREIIMTLIDNTIYSGKIVSYIFGDPLSNESFIIQWHIAPLKSVIGVDSMGYLEGNIIQHREIRSILFQEDKSIIYITSL